MQIYNVFINEFETFSKVIKKKQPGAKGPNQKKLLDYGNEFKKVIGKSFNPSGSGLKILTPQQMLARLPILLAQIKAGNNSQELKNEIRQLLYSLYRSKQISRTIYKSLIATIYETIFMNTANSKTKNSNKFVYNFIDKLNLKTLIKTLH